MGEDRRAAAPAPGKIKVPEAGAGNETTAMESKAKVMPNIGASDKAAKAAGLPRIVVKDGKMMELVSEEFISWLKSQPPSRPPRHYSVDALRRMGLDDEDLQVVLTGLRAVQTVGEIEKDILKQYDTTGHAYSQLVEGAGDEEEV